MAVTLKQPNVVFPILIHVSFVIIITLNKDCYFGYSLLMQNIYRIRCLRCCHFQEHGKTETKTDETTYRSSSLKPKKYGEYILLLSNIYFPYICTCGQIFPDRPTHRTFSLELNKARLKKEPPDGTEFKFQC